MEEVCLSVVITSVLYAEVSVREWVRMTSSARPKPVRRRKLRLAELKSHESLIAKNLNNDPRFRAEWKKSAFARAVALKILQYRAAKRLTQDQLAAKLGLRQSAVRPS